MAPPKKKRTYLAKVVEEQGRSYVWLARQTGFSADHIARVASGKHPGSISFHRLMMATLGVEYRIPRGAE